MNRVEIRYKIDQAYSSMNKYKTNNQCESVVEITS